MDDGRLPNLVVIGAMKCGTTALHRYLDEHPEIAMAAAKELNFFVGPEDPREAGDWHAGNWHRGRDWYAAQFAPAPVRGEASPAYTSPAHPEVAERMAAVVPGAKLVLLVRDPLDRAVSQFRHHRAEGTERRPVEQALLDPASQYLARSRYHERLAPFRAHFGDERIAVVLQEDLLERRRPTLAALYRFCGVDDAVWPPSAEHRLHVGTDDPCGLDPGLEAALVEALAPDVRRLARELGLDLASWRAY